MVDDLLHDEDPRQLAFPIARRLLESVVAIGDQHVELIERRQAVLTVLKHELDADCGYWSWGYGNPRDKSITGVGWINVELTNEQRAQIAKLSYDAEVFQDFYCAMFSEVEGTSRTRSMREEDFIKVDGAKLPQVRKYFADGGWGSWLQNVRYFPRNAFSNVVFFRNLGRPAFSQVDADVLDLVCTSISWLHANIGEEVAPAKFRKLTERQRTVLTMLLEGLPRKIISRRLGISEDTVGEHLTAIFDCFQVSSAMELASLFLKNQ